MLFMYLLAWALKEGKASFSFDSGAYLLAFYAAIELAAELVIIATCVL